MRPPGRAALEGQITFARVSAICQRGIVGRVAALAAAICFAASSAAAQERAGVGAQVGYSRADLIGDDADLVESRQGAITGVYLHLPLSAALSLRPEVLFSAKGGKILTLVLPDSAVRLVDIELAYLELPLLARLTLPRGRYRPVIFAGPSVAIQIGCDLLVEETANLTCGTDVAGVREWDVGWNAGVAVEMHLPRTTLGLQGRYSTGLRSILEGPVDLRNRGLAVLFGLTF